MIAGGAAIVVLAVMLVLYFLEAEIAIWMLIAFPAAVFIIGFFPARLLVNTYVREKISPLQHTLYNLNPEESNSERGLSNNDIEKEVDKEVKDRADKKKTELEKLKSLETYRKEFLGNVYHELKTTIFKNG